MDSAIHRRVERTISECRSLGIDPDPRTVAEIMVEDDVTAHKYENLSVERALTFVQYENTARVLTRPRLVVVPPTSDRRSA